MEFNLYQERSYWRDARLQRAARFVRILTGIMMLLSFNWMVLTIVEGIRLLTIATLVNMAIGSVVAGVIGKKIFLYDLWGDTVNTASRLERKGEEGRINIGNATYELIRDHFICVHRGKLPVRSKGDMDMYFVEREIE